MRNRANIVDIGFIEPDYMGFIFYAGSPRFVGSDFVVPAKLSELIKRVGVFVNEDVDRILLKVKESKLNFVQLHGSEAVSQCAALKETGVGVIKVFSVDKEFDFNTTTSYKGVVDYFLFDTKGENYGGNSIAFDWSALNQYDQEIPFFLSGGLSVANIGHVARIKAMNIHAVDVNSKVELSVGLKSTKLIIELKKKLGEVY